MRELATIDELFAVMAEGQALNDEQKRVELLANSIVRDKFLTACSHDPFSAEYRDWVLSRHEHVSGRGGYDPARDEQIPIEPKARARRPGIYTDGGSKHLGTFLEAIGQILQVADMAPGTRVLEYGPGDGQIALSLARMGCDVTVVDIEPKYLETIRLQADAIGIPIKTVHGDFSAPLEGKFDLILFFETFHHALDHQSLLQSLHEYTSEDGRLLFAGEPIIGEGSPWESVVPFPWGLRLDGLSLSAVKNYGWMELGFREDYFLDLLRRTGWSGTKFESQTNGRASGFIAKRIVNAHQVSQ